MPPKSPKSSNKKTPKKAAPRKANPAPGALVVPPSAQLAAHKKRKTCFVIMPIGDQDFGSVKISAAELHSRYSDLIREAVQTARDDIDVIRADEVTAGGGITNDIFDRLMRADYVIADVSYPNPNVYYELGIRHACRPGTIPIRDRNSQFRPAFDISTLRYVEYENTASGLKSLRLSLGQRLAWIDNNAATPDNMFLEYAQYVKYEFQRYSQGKHDETADVFMAILEYPELIMELSDPEVANNPQRMLAIMRKYPAVSKGMISLMLKSGKVSLPF